jgi:antitoxin VapB
MKTARLFRNGQSQAVRLLKEYRVSGDKVLIKKAGNAVVLLPEKGSWTPLLESLSRFPEAPSDRGGEDPLCALAK